MSNATGWALVRLSGEIDPSNVESLQQSIDWAVAGCPHVVIDLSSIEYMDSHGLRLLKRLSNKLVETGTKLEVVAPPDSIARQLLELTSMTDEIAVRDSRPA